ncbi:ATPase AAA domain-containing protein 2 [Nowakowskiella sp. JEL0078]|nr:ATPase AAA domain-containing protein 2 [Nowakowskiella sp. JEL0078]
MDRVTPIEDNTENSRARGQKRRRGADIDFISQNETEQNTDAPLGRRRRNPTKFFSSEPSPLQRTLRRRDSNEIPQRRRSDSGDYEIPHRELRSRNNRPLYYNEKSATRSRRNRSSRGSYAESDDDDFEQYIETIEVPSRVKRITSAKIFSDDSEEDFAEVNTSNDKERCTNNQESEDEEEVELANSRGKRPSRSSKNKNKSYANLIDDETSETKNIDNKVRLKLRVRTPTEPDALKSIDNHRLEINFDEEILSEKSGINPENEEFTVKSVEKQTLDIYEAVAPYIDDSKIEEKKEEDWEIEEENKKNKNSNSKSISSNKQIHTDSDFDEDINQKPKNTNSKINGRKNIKNINSDSDFDEVVDHDDSSHSVAEFEEILSDPESEEESHSDVPRYSLRSRSRIVNYNNHRKNQLQHRSRNRNSFPSESEINSRPSRAPRVNYKTQLMPDNPDELNRVVIDPEEADIRARVDDISKKALSQQSRTKLPKVKLAAFLGTDNDDEDSNSQEFVDLTIYGLPPNAAIKGNLAPINVRENMEARERLYRERLNATERALYEKTRLPEIVEEPFYWIHIPPPPEMAAPLSDMKTTFKDIGGLKNHIVSLKEMVIIPLLYPELVGKLNPPKGVLMHGPPGTGKTMIVRALASTCSSTNRPTALFMRKGADLLSKWLGESESQLIQLFEQARIWQPSIIFFDEIDGLAPARSGKNDHVHTSIVSTLLTLMDGLDNRGQVIVIGATNRIDAIDPALLRPGRFDRRIYFPLPDQQARYEILEMVTKYWNPPVQEDMKIKLVELTQGYCGADLKALGSEAMLAAVRRTYPQILEHDNKLLINPDDIRVTLEDVEVSLQSIVPSSSRYLSKPPSYPLESSLYPLLKNFLELVQRRTKAVVKRFSFTRTSLPVASSTERAEKSNNRAKMVLFSDKPRLLICGAPGMGQRHVAAAAIESLEKEGFQVTVIDEMKTTSDEMRQESIVVACIEDSLHNRPKSVLYIENLASLWETLSPTAQMVLVDKLNSLTGVLVLATSESPREEINEGLKKLFTHMSSDSQRKDFFIPYIECISEAIPLISRQHTIKKESSIELPIAPTLPPPPLTLSERNALEISEQAQLRDLRIILRDVLRVILKVRQYYVFKDIQPRDPTSPRLGLLHIGRKIDEEIYITPDDFLIEFTEILESVKEIADADGGIGNSNARDPPSIMLSDAHAMKDMAEKLLVGVFSPQASLKYQMIKARRLALNETKIEIEKGIEIGTVNGNLEIIKDSYINGSSDLEVIPEGMDVEIFKEAKLVEGSVLEATIGEIAKKANVECSNGKISETQVETPVLPGETVMEIATEKEKENLTQNEQFTYTIDFSEEKCLEKRLIIDTDMVMTEVSILEEIPAERILIVDFAKAELVCERLVSVTSMFSLEELQSVGTKLSQILLDFNDEDDRSIIIEEFDRVCDLLDQAAFKS